MAQHRVQVCYDISRYSTEKYFDIVWGYHPPGTPPNGPPKSQFFEWLKQGWVPVWFDISSYLTDKYFDIAWGIGVARGGARGLGLPPIEIPPMI